MQEWSLKAANVPNRSSNEWNIHATFISELSMYKTDIFIFVDEAETDRRAALRWYV